MDGDSIDNKVILITGGTGSFGKAVLKVLLKRKIKQIRIFSRDEKKQEDLRISLKSNRVQFFIGDVRDATSISQAMKGVDFVFHAAALKQVPSCEFYPVEAYKTNVQGTDNVLLEALKAGVKRLVLLSTDKAVYPINAMGISKAMAEKLLIAKSRFQSPGETILCATRYGNVMGSRGSVIPLFVNQIKSGVPLTITDPKMTRFLMSLEESVALVIFAMENGGQGDIFVQKSPACRVQDLADAILNIYNSKLGTEIIGTRHGEKLYETLISREEMAITEDLGDYYRIPCDNRDLNYSKYFSKGRIKVSDLMDYTSHNTNLLETSEIKKLLLNLNLEKGGAYD